MKHRYKQKAKHRKIATLGSLANLGFTLEVWCLGCVRYVDANAVEFAARLGPSTLITDAGRDSRCIHCGCDRIQVIPGPAPSSLCGVA